MVADIKIGQVSSINAVFPVFEQGISNGPVVSGYGQGGRPRSDSTYPCEVTRQAKDLISHHAVFVKVTEPIGIRQKIDHVAVHRILWIQVVRPRENVQYFNVQGTDVQNTNGEAMDTEQIRVRSGISIRNKYDKIAVRRPRRLDVRINIPG